MRLLCVVLRPERSNSSECPEYCMVGLPVNAYARAAMLTFRARCNDMALIGSALYAASAMIGGCSSSGLRPDEPAAARPDVVAVGDEAALESVVESPAPAEPAYDDTMAPYELDAAQVQSWLAMTATVPLEEIDVQLDYQGTYAFTPHYQRVPQLTLYRDGTIIYVKRATLMRAELGVEERAALIDQLVELGGLEVKNYGCFVGVDHRCGPRGGMHDPFVILRIRNPADGVLVSRMAFGTFGPEHREVRQLLRSYVHESGRPFVATRATLRGSVVVEPLNDSRCVQIQAGDLRRPAGRPDAWLAAADAALLKRLKFALTRESQEKIVCVGNEAYLLEVVPWLPHVNHEAILVKANAALMAPDGEEKEFRWYHDYHGGFPGSAATK